MLLAQAEAEFAAAEEFGNADLPGSLGAKLGNLGLELLQVCADVLAVWCAGVPMRQPGFAAAAGMIMGGYAGVCIRGPGLEPLQVCAGMNVSLNGYGAACI